MRLNSSSPMVPSVRPYLMREAIECNQHALELEQAQRAISMRPYLMREAIMRNQAISMRLNSSRPRGPSACARTCPYGNHMQ
jgi:hypothetical protein